MCERGPRKPAGESPETKGRPAGRPLAAEKGAAAQGVRTSKAEKTDDEFIRPENEDDDGYDPYSDRRLEPEPLFERDPWA